MIFKNKIINEDASHLKVSLKKRLLEIICVFFGHIFNEYSAESDDLEGLVCEQFKCDRCKLSVVKFYLYKEKNNLLKRITFE